MVLIHIFQFQVFCWIDSLADIVFALIKDLFSWVLQTIMGDKTSYDNLTQAFIEVSAYKQPQKFIC